MRYLLAIAFVTTLSLPMLAATCGPPIEVMPASERSEPMPPWTGRLQSWSDHVAVLSWRRFHTGNGQFDWAYVDALLESKAPAHLILLVQATNPLRDLTPQWVYGFLSNINPPLADWPGHGKTGYWLSDCGGWPIPRYDSYTWRHYLWQAIKALGEHYDGDPRLGSVAVSIGLDGEPQIVKSINGCRPDISGITGLEHRFGQLIDATIPVFAEAFPNTPVYMQTAVGGEARAHWAQIAVDNGIGLKNAGLGPDFLGWESDTPEIGTGSFDPVLLWGSQGVPIHLETKSGLGDEAVKREALIAGLRYMPQSMTVHNEYMELDQGFLRWVDAHLGVPIPEQPSVFVCFRETVIKPRCWPGSDGIERCVHGRRGDDGLGIVATAEGEPRTGGPGWRGRHYREGDYWSLDVADDYVSSDYEIIVTYLDAVASGSFTVHWESGERQIDFGGTGAWRDAVFAAELDPAGADDIIIEGQVALDRVEVVGWDMHFGTATPTSTMRTPSPTLTSGFPGTMTPSATNPCLPSRTSTIGMPSVTPSWCITETPLASRTPSSLTPVSTPSATPTIDLAKLQQLMDAEMCRRLGWPVPCGQWIHTWIPRQ